MKYHIIIVLIVVVLCIALIIGYTQFNHQVNESQVCLNESCFYVELATTSDEQSRGLMFRDHLDQDRGMLFIFPKEDTYSFWMKNTLIPLDIIWISEEKKVVYISKNTQPCGELSCPMINPGEKAKYVLEVNAGVSDNVGLLVGDKIAIDYL